MQRESLPMSWWRRLTNLDWMDRVAFEKGIRLVTYTLSADKSLMCCWSVLRIYFRNARLYINCISFQDRPGNKIPCYFYMGSDNRMKESRVSDNLPSLRWCRPYSDWMYVATKLSELRTSWSACWLLRDRRGMPGVQCIRYEDGRVLLEGMVVSIIKLN